MNKAIGSTFDSFLEEAGIKEEVCLMAAEKVARMQPYNRTGIHPSVILREDFGVADPPEITPDTAYKLAVEFGTTPEFWLNLQAAYEATKKT